MKWSQTTYLRAIDISKPTYNVFYLFNLLDNTTDSFCGSPGNQSVYVRARFEYLSKKHLFKDLDNCFMFSYRVKPFII